MLRKHICEIGRRLWTRGLVAAHDGNISVRLDSNAVLCTPSGVSKGYMDAGELLIVDMDGKPLAYGSRPTSELRMHLEIYRGRGDVNAVVHAHPPHATAFALAGQVMPERVMPEIDILLGKVPLIPYLAPGTESFAEGFRPFLKDCNAFLLSNHGATTIGSTLEEAWFRMESLDSCCRSLLFSQQLGGWTTYK